MPATVTKIRSIQGEQTEIDWQMSDGDVDDYVKDASDQALTCRELGHRYPSLREVIKREGGIHFDAQDVDGAWLRRVVCECCGMAVKHERWIRRQIGKQARYEPESGSKLGYQRGPNGETYPAKPGRGRPTRRQIRGSIATQVLGSMTVTQVRKSMRKGA